MKIGLFRDPTYAPCSFLIIKVDENNHALPYRGAANEANSVLIQTDWDHPGVARTFGFTGKNDCAKCGHEGTDGTIDCPECGRTATQFIGEAGEWLHDKATRADHDWPAEVTAEDPGYFAAERATP